MDNKILSKNELLFLCSFSETGIYELVDTNKRAENYNYIVQNYMENRRIILYYKDRSKRKERSFKVKYYIKRGMFQ